jgi:myo-inositol-1(or 4)-monophosphatase
MQFELIAEVAVQACKSAGDILLRSFGRSGAVASLKEDQYNIVTAADVQSEAALISHISATFPAHSFLAEESGLLQRNSTDLWIVDPLDGTSNFAAGLPWFGVLAAHVTNGTPDVAVMHLPITGETYCAIRGQGCTKNGTMVQVTASTSLHEVLWAYGMDDPGEGPTAEEKQQVLLRILRSARNVRATNCLLDAAYTAEGRLGGMLNWSCRAWDVAAPSLIVEEAGGRYTTLDGTPIRFDVWADSIDQVYAVVAGAKPLYAEVIQFVREVQSAVWNRPN